MITKTQDGSTAPPVDLIVGQQKATPAVVRAAFAFWMDAKTTAQKEIQKLRQVCPHENKEVTTRSDETDVNILMLHCRDCGKWLGDECLDVLRQIRSEHPSYWMIDKLIDDVMIKNGLTT